MFDACEGALPDLALQPHWSKPFKAARKKTLRINCQVSLLHCILVDSVVLLLLGRGVTACLKLVPVSSRKAEANSVANCTAPSSQLRFRKKCQDKGRAPFHEPGQSFSTYICRPCFQSDSSTSEPSNIEPRASRDLVQSSLATARAPNEPSAFNMATSSVPVEAPAPAQQAPAPGHRDFYAEGQSQPYAQHTAPHQHQQYQYPQSPQTPFYVFNPSMPYPNDKPGAQATGHFSPYQAPPPTIPVEFRYTTQPHGRSKRLTRSVLALHVVFLLFGLGWLGLSAYVMSYNGKELGFSSGELLFLLSVSCVLLGAARAFADFHPRPSSRSLQTALPLASSPYATSCLGG